MRVKILLRIFAIFAACMLVSGCAASIHQEDLLKKLQEQQAPVIIDVRSQAEYDRDHLPGALRIPFYAIGSGLDELKFQKDKPVVLYCEHGPRAGFASLSLYLQGYEQVLSLEGHMKGWREKGLPVENSSRQYSSRD